MTESELVALFAAIPETVDLIAEAVVAGDDGLALLLATELDEVFRVLGDLVDDYGRDGLLMVVGAGLASVGVAAGVIPDLVALITGQVTGVGRLAAAVRAAGAGRSRRVVSRLLRVRGSEPEPVRDPARVVRQLRARGLGTVTYRNGARVPVEVHAEMVVATETALAYNTGQAKGFRVLAALAGDISGDGLWVEVRDGLGCGWLRHDDPDRAHGTFRRLSDFEAHPIAHPRCRRVMVPRPDIRSDTDVDGAVLSGGGPVPSVPPAYANVLAGVRGVRGARQVRSPRTFRP